MMNGLIKIETDDNLNKVVSGRSLHMFLEIETPYAKWFARMCEYGFEEGKDFWTKMSESTGGRPGTDHLMSISMAKELAMIQRTEKGKQAREYFIAVENAWNSDDMVLARAVSILDKKVKAQDQIISDQKLLIAAKDKELEEARPKTIFADAVSVAKNSMLVRDLAKLLRQNNIDMGEKRLYKWMRDNGYICKGDTSPTQKAMELGLFEVKISVIDRGDDKPIEKRTTKVTGKGQIYFVNKFKAAQEKEEA